MASTDPITLDAYVVDALLPDLIGHDRHPSAFLVYIVLWRHAGGGTRTVAMSLRALAESTGLSKRAVQDAVANLVRRRLVALERDTPTSVPTYEVLRPWAARVRR